MRALMGFDQINRLDDNSSSDTGDTSSPSTGSSAGAGIGGSSVDFGSLAQGETVIDQVDKNVSALIQRCKELADLFKERISDWVRGFRK